VSFVDGQIGISIETGWVSGYGVVASGSLHITEDEPEAMWVRINPIPHGYLDIYQGQISLDAAGGGNVFFSSFDPLVDPYFDFVVPLSPGQYTLAWYTQEDYPWNYGAGGFSFSMGAGSGQIRRRQAAPTKGDNMSSEIQDEAGKKLPDPKHVGPNSIQDEAAKRTPVPKQVGPERFHGRIDELSILVGAVGASLVGSAAADGALPAGLAAFLDDWYCGTPPRPSGHPARG
jgi:hypothetical protein